MTFPQVCCPGWRRMWITYSCPSVTLKHCQQCLQSQIQRRKTITKTQTIIKTKTKCISVLYFCHQLWGCPGARANLHKTTPPTTRGLPHKPGKMPPDTLPSCLLLESLFLCCPQRPVQSHPWSKHDCSSWINHWMPYYVFASFFAISLESSYHGQLMELGNRCSCSCVPDYA